MRTSQASEPVVTMRAKLASLPSASNSRRNALKIALMTGALAALALMDHQSAHADAALCGKGSQCAPDLSSPAEDQHFFRFSMAHDQSSQHDSLRRSEVTSKDFVS